MATLFNLEQVRLGCPQCESQLDFEFTFAFQPIVDIQQQTLYGYEALVRDPETLSAKTVLDKVNDQNRYAFDQACRKKAIAIASYLGLDKILSINFLPNAVYEPEHCIRSTLRAAKAVNFPIDKIMFEITESEEVLDKDHLRKIFQYYESQGFITALDDFGAGHSGLNMLASFLPKLLKIDIELVKDIHLDKVKQTIARALITLCAELKIAILAEGIEREEEAIFFAQQGVTLMQGYYFAKPAVETLPQVSSERMETVAKHFVPHL